MLKNNYFRVLSLFLLLCSVWALVFWPTLQNMEAVWRSSDTYTHCYIIPLISAWLLYDQRQSIHAPAKPTLLPLFPALACAAVWLVGYAADVNSLTHFSAVFVLQLLTLSLLGWQLGRQVAFPLFYLIFMVPFGDALNLPLQDLTATVSVMMLNLTGIPVLREGLYLTTPVGQFEVAEACSGLRFLIASIAIGTLFSFLTYRIWWKHLLFVSAILVFSVLANCMRAFFLIWIGETSNMQYGFGADHFVYGWLFFALVMFSMFWLGGRFADKAPAVPAVTATPATGTFWQPVGCALLVLGATLMLRSQITEVAAPAEPQQLAAPAEFSTAPARQWQPGFFDGLARLQVWDAQGNGYLLARYGHKQQKGELISWNNRLYQRKTWSETGHKMMTLAGEPYRLIELRHESGQRQVVFYQYRIAEHRTSSAEQAKLYQVLALISGDQNYSEVRAVNLPGAFADIQPQQLEQAAARLQALPGL
jgi:exosortase A